MPHVVSKVALCKSNRVQKYVIFFQANDADGPLQGDGRIRYTLESDNSITHKGKVFNIDEDTGEMIIIDKVETMDTPRGQYELVVRATDYGKKKYLPLCFL